MKKLSALVEKFDAGHLEKGIDYRYFVPSEINRLWVWEDAGLNTLLEKASIKLGELNSFARLVPNIDLFIQLHVTKEAVVSSRIEGTQTNMDEALLPEEEIRPERRNDWQEVHNYTNALNNAIKELERLPLSSRLLRQAHKILMQGVRGEHKMPGEFRSSQNWIGGASLADAVFIPPAPHYVNPLMGDLENFLHNRDIQVPALIRVGLAHYQFETIHPFLDGNGRIGRLLITLYLVSENILEKPLLYLSVFFEKNKTLYYDNLTRVREKNDLLQWLKYFLIGVEETATRAVQTLTAIMVLKSKMEKEIHDKLGRRSNSGLKLLIHLFKKPIVNVKDVEQVCQLSTKAANDLVSSFEENEWLRKMGDSERYRRFVFEPYLRLFE
ncbi:MAG: cell filamentation protein Fic [Sphingobacteriales bacterium 46-32]|nr:MAG: cell filamentation protein Fic [Sphingobacteriales bacterium 46-32]